MAITDTINLMKTNITNAYSAIETKGGTIPTNKNLENMAAAISSITVSAGSAIEEVSTQTALKEKCIAANAGKVYRYTGTTSGNYINGALYRVNYVSQSAIDKYILGLDICKQMTPYTITWSGSSYTKTGENENTIYLNGSKKIIIAADADYTLPDTITVSGCSYTWDKDTGALVLSNPTGAVSVTINAKLASMTTDQILSYLNQWGIVGMEPCVTTWNENQCQAWTENFNVIQISYVQVLIPGMSSATNTAELQQAVAQHLNIVGGIYQNAIQVNYNIEIQSTGDNDIVLITMVNTLTGASAQYGITKQYS